MACGMCLIRSSGRDFDDFASVMNKPASALDRTTLSRFGKVGFDKKGPTCNTIRGSVKFEFSGVGTHSNADPSCWKELPSNLNDQRGDLD